MSIKFARIKKYLELDDQIRFGVHVGKTISWMLEFEPEYLLWATRQPNLIFLSSTAALRLEQNAQRAKLERLAKKQAQFERVIGGYSLSRELNDLDLWLDDVPF